MLIETLQQYGLSEKEAKVYMAGLALGSAPGSTIARHAAENRVTVYSILKELVKKGIFTTLTRQGIAYFSPISPEILVRNIEDKYNSIKEKLPELMALIDKGGSKPKVQFFEGVEGIKQVLQSILDDAQNMKSEDYILAFQGNQNMDNEILEYIENIVINIRKTYPVKTKMIISGASETYNIKNHIDQVEYILVDDPCFNIANEIVLYDNNKVALLLYNQEEKSACIIESKTLFDALKSMFELLWKFLYKKPIKKGKAKI